MALILQYVGAFLALLISGGIVNLIISHHIDKRRKAVETETRKKERAARLNLFSLEAVELQERWVQYARQARIPEISRSSPFELTTAEQVNELIKLGVDAPVLSAIYFIKELNNDVRRQVIRAQDEH